MINSLSTHNEFITNTVAKYSGKKLVVCNKWRPEPTLKKRGETEKPYE